MHVVRLELTTESILLLNTTNRRQTHFLLTYYGELFLNATSLTPFPGSFAWRRAGGLSQVYRTNLRGDPGLEVYTVRAYFYSQYLNKLLKIK